MEGSLADSILQVCKILNKHSVEYLMVGGAAVGFHGYFRLLRQPSGEVAEDISSYKAEESPNPKKSFFRLEYDKFTVDFLPELPGLPRFRDSYKKCETNPRAAKRH